MKLELISETLKFENPQDLKTNFIFVAAAYGT